MKFLVRTVGLLLVVNVLLVYMHYKQADDALAKGSEFVTYHQEIEVVNRPDALYIRHHFSELSSGRHEIVWPETSVGRSCYLADATSCDRLDEHTTAFLDGNNDRQSISYEIPKIGPMKKNALFHEPFATLHGSTSEFTLFHITDETGIGGLWVNGLERIGDKKMDHIDYALYRGSGEIKDLYWQQNNLPLLYEGEKLSVFGRSTPIDNLTEIDEALKAIDANYSTIVIDRENPAVESTRFIVSGNTDVDKVSDLFLTNNMNARFSIPRQERLTTEVIASILGEKAVGTVKSRKAYQQLTESITEEEFQQLKELLDGRIGQEIDATVLDGLIGEVTGFKTSYFTRNVQDNTVEHPFLIEDPRKVLLEGTSHPDIRIILKDGNTFYPASKILGLAGYSVSSNERSIYIENEMRKFRFPMKELFYVYNERKFNVHMNPFEIIEGDFYFEESWFKRLFLLSIDKTDETINIVQISKVIEEASN